MKRLKLMIVFILLFMVGTTNLNAATIKDSFKDANLASCVAQSLNQEVSEQTTKINSMKILDCQNSKIKDLTGIDKIKNLESVNLANNNIKSAIPLSGLNLISLDLSNNEGLSDLNYLYYIKTLKELYLDGNKSKGMEILSEFSSLTKLSVASNDIDSIYFLTSLKNLVDLDISQNNVKSINELAKLTNLKNLSAAYNNLSNIKTLPKNIETLNINNNKIKEIIPLKTYSKLYYLDLANNEIANVEFAKDTNIKFLDISYNNVSEIEPLNTITTLEVITLDYDKIKDKDKLNSNVLKLYESNNGKIMIEGKEDKKSVDNNWLNDNLHYIIIGAISLLIVILIIVVAIRSRRKPAKTQEVEEEDVYLDIVDVVEVKPDEIVEEEIIEVPVETLEDNLEAEEIDDEVVLDTAEIVTVVKERKPRSNKRRKPAAKAKKSTAKNKRKATNSKSKPKATTTKSTSKSKATTTKAKATNNSNSKKKRTTTKKRKNKVRKQG